MPNANAISRVGQLLFTARLRAELTQADVAKRLKLNSPQYLSNIERGMATLSPRHFRTVARIVNIKPELFVRAAVADYDTELRRKFL